MRARNQAIALYELSTQSSRNAAAMYISRQLIISRKGNEAQSLKCQYISKCQNGRADNGTSFVSEALNNAGANCQRGERP